jgi:putative membrane protein
VDHRAGHVASRTLAASVVGGIIGGLVGAAAMSAIHRWLSGPPPAGERAASEQEPDATVKVADRLSRTVRGAPLPDHLRAAAGSTVHYGFGAVMGAAQGAMAAVTPIAGVGGGLGFGALVWAGAHAIVVPALGLAPSPRRRPPRQEALELGLHLVYGVCAERVRRLAVRLLA